VFFFFATQLHCLALSQKGNASTQNREQEAGLNENSSGSGSRDSRRGRVGLSGLHNHSRSLEDRRLRGGHDVGARVRVTTGGTDRDGRVGDGVRRNRAGGGDDDLRRSSGDDGGAGSRRRRGSEARAVGDGRVALSDGDGLSHGRGRGKGLIDLLSGESQASGHKGEEALELHFDRRSEE